MPLPDELRRLDADLPACPATLLRLLALLERDDAPDREIAALIETDLALAGALLRTVNSAMFGLLRRVETVGEALRFLGLREVAALTYETALRAAFPPSPAMQALWQQASRCGLLMGRSAAALELDGFHAHTAGLFSRSGQAVLLAHAPQRYGALLAGLGHDREALLAAEVEAFGVHHAAYGSALCAAWGLAGGVVRFLRERVRPPAHWTGLDRHTQRLLALGAAVDSLLAEADLDQAAQQGGLEPVCPPEVLRQALQRPWTMLQAQPA